MEGFQAAHDNHIYSTHTHTHTHTHTPTRSRHDSNDTPLSRRRYGKLILRICTRIISKEQKCHGIHRTRSYFQPLTKRIWRTHSSQKNERVSLTVVLLPESTSTHGTQSDGAVSFQFHEPLSCLRPWKKIFTVPFGFQRKLTPTEFELECQFRSVKNGK